MRIGPYSYLVLPLEAVIEGVYEARCRPFRPAALR